MIRAAIPNDVTWRDGRGPWVAWHEETKTVAEGPTEEIAKERVMKILNSRRH